MAMPESAARSKFTLRFRDARNHTLLGVIAERYGVSKNQLAEEMLERELQAAALGLEQDLTDTLEMLRGYRREDDLEGAIEAFAQAEAGESDPIRTRLSSPAGASDAYDIAGLFSS